MARVEIKIPDWLDRIFAWPVMIYRKRKFGYAFRGIYLGEGKFTIVDPPDFHRFNSFNWCLNKNGPNTYAVRVITVHKRSIKLVSLHREIMNHPKGFLVDHRNGNGLDSRRENLRIATKAQNMYNSRKRKNTSSGFIGVSFHKRSKLWSARIKNQGKSVWLGYFKNEIDAARAYDAAARKYHGEFARLNFPEEAALS